MATKKPSKKTKLPAYSMAPSVKEIDKALYQFLQMTYDLKLISEKAFHHATTCETKLYGE
jgi:hypothetical protein